MRYRVTTKEGKVQEFDAPFMESSIRKTMGLPLTAKIEVIIQGDSNGQTSTTVEQTVAS